MKKCSILGLNVCGLLSKLKLGILQEYIQSFDIVCLNETKTDNLLSDELNDYKCLYKKRVNHRYGGVHGLCILIKNDKAEFVTEIDYNTESVLWIKVDKNITGFEFILGAVYIPHEGSVHYDVDVYDNIANDVINISDKYQLPILLIGDFNSRTGLLDDFVTYDDTVASICGIDTEDAMLHDCKQQMADMGVAMQRHNEDAKVNNNGLKLIEFCKSLNFKIVNGRFGTDNGKGKITCQTAQGHSTVDYVVASSSLLPFITDFCVDQYDNCLSDVHSPIYISLQEAETPNKNSLTEGDNDDEAHDQSEFCNSGNIHQGIKSKWNPSLLTQYKNMFSNEFMGELRAKISDLESTEVNQENIDTICEIANKVFIEPALKLGMAKQVKNAPKPKRVITAHKPWFNADCKAMKADYIRIKNRLKQDNTAFARDQYMNKAKEYRKFIKRTSRSYFKNLHKSLRQLKSSNPKQYWEILNKGSHDVTKLGKIAIDTFYKHFKKLSQKDETLVIDPDADSKEPDDFNPQSVNGQVNEEMNKPFTFDEVSKVVSKLKCNKACGIDHIINEFIKHSPHEMIEIITKLFNVVLNSGIIPTQWCVGLIKPLYKKKGSVDDPDNYRGITLLSCIGKLFTSLLNKRLTNYVEAANIIGQEQAGFREGFSTNDHIFVLHSILDLYLHKRKRVYCAFVDYKKAFDLVDRSSLWTKLISCGINGKVFTAIHNLYDNAKSCVKLDGNVLSQHFVCNIGVRQGDNLSPLLFAIYLNDFEAFLSTKYKGLDILSNDVNVNLSDSELEVFLKLYALLYADDTIVMAETVQELQNALNATHDYCNQWHLTVNTNKTKIVVFSRGKIRNIPMFYFGNCKLDVVFDYVYLGTTFNYNNNF